MRPEELALARTNSLEFHTAVKEFELRHESEGLREGTVFPPQSLQGHSPRVEEPLGIEGLPPR